MRRECAFLLIALAVQFSSAQLDLSFIDPFYYLYNLQNNHNFNNGHNNINNNDNFNNNNNNFLGDFYQQPLIGCIANTNNLQGTCMQGHECKYSRGQYSGRGNCSILHSCCTYSKTCNQTVRARVVYFQNPANPRSQPSPCTLRLQLMNEDICQIRVDITQLDLEFENVGAANIPTCLEYITVDPAPIEPIPQVCGETTNNHFYIHLNRNNLNSGYININVLLQQFAQNIDSSGTWNMRLTQLECPGRKNKKTSVNHKKRNENQAADDFGELAPAGCSQYFTQPNGIVQFFTDGTGTTTPAAADGLIANNYAACFKRFPNICGVVFRKPTGMSPQECEEFAMMLFMGTSVDPNLFPDYCMDPSTPITLSHEGPLFLEILSRVMRIPGAPIEYSLTTVC